MPARKRQGIISDKRNKHHNISGGEFTEPTFIHINTKDMKQKKGFALRTVCGENIIVAEGLETVDFSKVINLNETATFLWKEAEKQGDFSVDSLTEALCKEYEVEKSIATADIDRIVGEWKEIGIVE